MHCICSILTLWAHLVKYWFSVLFASLVDANNVPSIPADIGKYKGEWLDKDGVVFSQHVLNHSWELVDWWGLRAFAQKCQLGGTGVARPVGHQFLDGEAQRILSPYLDRFLSALRWSSKVFTTKTTSLTELYAKADTLQVDFAMEAVQLRTALSSAVLSLLRSVQTAFKAALANPSPSLTLPCQAGQQLESTAFDSLVEEVVADLKAWGGRTSRVFSGLAPRELESRLLSVEAQLSQSGGRSSLA